MKVNENMNGLLSLIFILVLISCKNGKKKNHPTADYVPEIEIIEKPIPYSPKRTQLSIQYLKERYNIIRNKPTIDPVMIVLHYTDGGSASSIYNYFSSDTIEATRKFNKKASLLNVSSHYLIDRDGRVYHLVPDTLFARHIIGLNHCSIGIENIGSKKYPLTNQQVESNAKLIRYLSKKHNIEFLIGHSEYEVFRHTRWWKETDPDYYTVKEDPGVDFMQKVRALLRDISLKSKPI